MTTWAIIKDNKVINRIIADTKEVAEEVSGFEAIDDQGWIGIGFENTPDGWRLPYPNDGQQYVWNNEFHYWALVVNE